MPGSQIPTTTPERVEPSVPVNTDPKVNSPQPRGVTPSQQSVGVETKNEPSIDVSASILGTVSEAQRQERNPLKKFSKESLEQYFQTHNTSSIVTIRNQLWPSEMGKEKPDLPGVSAVSRLAVSLFPPFQGRERSSGNKLQKLFHQPLTVQEVNMNFIDLLVSKLPKPLDPNSRASQQAPPKKKPEMDVPRDNANPIFSVRQSSDSQNHAALYQIFSDCSDEDVDAWIQLVDTYAFVTPAPAKAIAHSRNIKGGLKSRMDPRLTHAEIIDFCCNANRLKGVIQSRVPDASTAYRRFLTMISTLGGDKVGILNWSWETLCNFLAKKYPARCEHIIDLATARLDLQNEISAGAYGPFLWRFRTQILLDIHLALAKELKEQFKATRDNRKLSAKNFQGDNAKYVNIPLCGADCFGYMTQEQIAKRLNIGVPWAMYAETPIVIKSRTVERDQVGKIINKSASEFKAFLAAQRRAARPPRVNKFATRVKQNSFNVDDWA